jgi:hypothetical protein
MITVLSMLIFIPYFYVTGLAHLGSPSLNLDASVTERLAVNLTLAGRLSGHSFCPVRRANFLAEVLLLHGSTTQVQSPTLVLWGPCPIVLARSSSPKGAACTCTRHHDSNIGNASFLWDERIFGSCLLAAIVISIAVSVLLEAQIKVCPSDYRSVAHSHFSGFLQFRYVILRNPIQCERVYSASECVLRYIVYCASFP